MVSIMELLVWLYLAVGLLPALVAWQRDLPARSVRHAAIAGALFGWTLIGYVIAWIIAIDDKPAARVRVSFITR